MSETEKISNAAPDSVTTFRLDDYVEKIFLLAALVVIGAGVVVGYFFSDINSGAENKLANNLLDPRGICLGVSFGVINFHGWKKFVRLLLNDAVDVTAGAKRAPRRFAFFLAFKGAVLFLFIGGLFRFGVHLIPGFLTGLAGYLLLGGLLATLSANKLSKAKTLTPQTSVSDRTERP